MCACSLQICEDTLRVVKFFGLGEVAACVARDESGTPEFGNAE